MLPAAGDGVVEEEPFDFVAMPQNPIEDPVIDGNEVGNPRDLLPNPIEDPVVDENEAINPNGMLPEAEDGVAKEEPFDFVAMPRNPIEDPVVDVIEVGNPPDMLPGAGDGVLKEEPFDYGAMRASLDNNTSGASDCVIIAEYFEFLVNEQIEEVEVESTGNLNGD